VLKARRAIEAIESGSLPPQPVADHLCSSCGYSGVCRKEIEEGR
jgi:CRISPR/Cas system-associated exonuclease Cas4 (RecB family)